MQHVGWVNDGKQVAAHQQHCFDDRNVAAATVIQHLLDYRIMLDDSSRENNAQVSLSDESSGEDDVVPIPAGVKIYSPKTILEHGLLFVGFSDFQIGRCKTKTNVK